MSAPPKRKAIRKPRAKVPAKTPAKLPTKLSRKKKPRTFQHTVRHVPADVDAALRTKAAAEKTSLNDAVLHTLRTGLNALGYPVKYRDLSFLAGTLDDETAAILEDVEKWCDPLDLKEWE